MTESPVSSADSSSLPERDRESFSPENLPPVEPPSAGFILQLFVVPAIIVAAVIGIWLLFGQLASSDQDWQRQVDELRQSNEHRRWRGAMSLAQMMEADAKAEEAGRQLSQNSELATSLGNVLREQMAIASPTEEERKLRAYLVVAIGWLDVDEVTLPILLSALESGQDLEMRQNGIASLALIAGRRFERGDPLRNDDVLAKLLGVSRENEVELRRLSAFALGLLGDPAATQRLQVMLEDPDSYVRVNSAIALTRQKSTKGLPILREVLSRAANEPSPLEVMERGNEESERAANAGEFELILATRNSLKAIQELAPQLSEVEKTDLRSLIEPISREFRDPRIGISATETLKSLQSSSRE